MRTLAYSSFLKRRRCCLLGSYRIETTPEPNSNRLTSFKSTRFDSPANNVCPWPASLGCTKNSYSSIKLNASTRGCHIRIRMFLASTICTSTESLDELAAPDHVRLVAHHFMRDRIARQVIFTMG
jgi:hypothetical protein